MAIGLRIFYNPAWMGGVNYVLNTARMLRYLPKEEQPEIIFLTSTPQAEEIAQTYRHLADDVQPITRASQLDLDFVYPATQLAEAPFGAPWAGWIPDWQCQHKPDMFSRDERIRRFMQYRELAYHPAGCVFSSKQAYEDSENLFPDADRSKWHIFHFPAVFEDDFWNLTEGEIAQTRESLGVPENYFIICNQFWKHKNHLLVAKALAENPDLDIHIVMTGAVTDTRWSEYADEVKKTLAVEHVANRVTLTDSIDRDTQLKLLAGAQGYIQPSFFEGWSTFVEESRAIGLPGLISDIPVHQEQKPPQSVFFDPSDVAMFSEKLRDFVTSGVKKPDMKTARERHDAYIREQARSFLKVIKATSNHFDINTHGTNAILAKRIPELYDESLGAEHFDEDDFNRWLATIRLLLRDYPEELAVLGGKVCSEDTAFAQKAELLVVLATLSKCSPEIRQRFLDFEPEDENAALAKVQADVARPKVQISLAINNTIFRLKDLIRRKLPNA